MSRIRIIEKVGSTNRALMEDGEAVDGDWLIALRQSAGKGRQGRQWIDQPGNFSGSALLRLRDGDPPPQTLSLVAGLALAEAVDAALPGLPLLLKWPNDLLLQGAKLAGILLERQGDRVVIGFGVNLAAAPAVDDRRIAHLGAAITPQAFAPILAGTLTRMVELWRGATPMLFAQAWQARAHPIGSALQVHGEDGASVAGTFDGLEQDGSLRLRLANGALRTVHAGDVALG